MGILFAVLICTYLGSFILVLGIGISSFLSRRVAKRFAMHTVGDALHVVFVSVLPIINIIVVTALIATAMDSTLNKRLHQ